MKPRGGMGMTILGYTRIFTDENDTSHFETCEITLEQTAYAPPADALFTSSPEPATTTLFLELPAGWAGEWHPTPVRQWLILMSGECSFEVGSGEKRIAKAGEAILLEDMAGKGHRTVVLSDEPMRIAAIHLP